MADREWTVMFFFAGDDTALSPLIVSQLKALKDAGFHQDVDALAHFDSNEAGVPTRVFDVNRKRKEKARAEGIRSHVGDGRDSFVHNMADDNVDPKEIVGEPGSASAKLQISLKNPDTSNAGDALKNFLGFCREKHRAKNYILFVLGHGLVVGNDTFLPDDNPPSAITLEGFQTILKEFTDNIKKDTSEESPNGGVLQLLALHSCAMSAIEVAYQLKGTARYMIGTEGVAFVESWPYRQLLKRIFNFVDEPRMRPQDGWRRREDDRDAEERKEEEREANDPHAKDPRRLISKLYFHSLFNSADYMISGYSLDLCLCNLEHKQKDDDPPSNFDQLSEKIRALVVRLKSALEIDLKPEEDAKAAPVSKLGQELILLAHWESQSYWGESYTDLFDFCRCLRERCKGALGLLEKYGDEKKTGGIQDELKKLIPACSDVMTLLERERSDDGDPEKEYSKLVVHSCHFGPKYQYSHGLSVYFPWSRPVDDDPAAKAFMQTRTLPNGQKDTRGVMGRYHDYFFNKEIEDQAKGESWASFLDAYFDKTKRPPRVKEDGESAADEGGSIPFVPVELSGGTDNPFSALADKESGRVGASCTCPSIKNYDNTITVSSILKKRMFKS